MTGTGIQRNIADILPPGTPEQRRIKDMFHPRRSHGGAESRGKRKTKRPFETHAPIHLCLSSDRARGLWSLGHRSNRARVSSRIYVYAERYKIRVYRANVEGGKIHLLIKAQDRKNLADFLRVLAGRVAIMITGAKKHEKRVGKFWKDLCWSKLINWGSEFYGVRSLIAGLDKQTKIRPDPKDEFLASPRLLSLEDGIP
ncbi:MAG: transposase [Bdellovibrionales bacterium]|nr:transposase [Bdellovibrionales bacterium]